MQTAVRARRILPLTGEKPARGLAALNAPLRTLDDGVIVAKDGRVTDVLPYKDYCRAAGAATLTDLGDVVLVPGLVNCHTHLELSQMGAKTVLGQGFLPWLRSLIALIAADDAPLAPALNAAVSALRRSGTAHVGDVITRRPDLVAPALHRQGLGATLFLECIGFDPQTPERLMEQAALPLFADGGAPLVFSLAGHALYSTAPETLVRAKAWCDAACKPFSLHLAEHQDETEFLQSGAGPFADLLRQRLVPEGWRAPGRRPVAEAARLGLLGPGTLAVHCVHCNPEETIIISQSGAALCLCPRSNEAIGVGEAPAAAFARAGALLTLGTDSLASNDSLDLWGELRWMLKKNILPANALLRMATVNGASALRLSGGLGTLDSCSPFCYSLIPDDIAAFFL